MIAAKSINTDNIMHQDNRMHSEDEKSFQIVSGQPPKSIRNFTDLPAPFYSQRGSLISHENNSVLIKESGYADRTNTITSLQSLLSDKSDAEENKPLKSAANLNPEFYAAQSIIETSNGNSPKSVPKSPGVDLSSSGERVNFNARPGSLDIRREPMVAGNGRNKLPTFMDNPSTPTDFSHLSKETVDADNYSNASDDKKDQDSEQVTKKVLNKWILLSVIGLFLFGIFSLAFQWNQSLYVARDEKNSKDIPSNVSLTEVDSYITRHPENRIGLWSECNDFSCIDLRIFCSYDDIQKTLIESKLVSFATESQVDDFVKNQLHLCPMIKVSRFTSVLSLFAAAIALIGLIIAFFKNQKLIYLAIKASGILMGKILS